MAKKSMTVKLTPNLKELIRNEFVQGIELSDDKRQTFTLEELIKKHGVAKTTLYRAAQDADWKGQRDRFQEEYLSKLDHRRAKELVHESKGIDSESVKVAKHVLGAISKQVEKNYHAVMEEKSGMSPSQILTLSNAAMVAQKMAKLALGESTSNININADIKENTSFRRAMELLDELEDAKRAEGGSVTH
tara:strand:+ start:490 stop:1059 length:570 start_codon:yes stop_codon:yes gene_type:complete